MRPIARIVLALVLAAAATSCAARAHSIARLKSDPRYHDKRVRIEGVVTTAWGIPLVPFKFYKIDDGTGELTVLSRHSRTPTRGAQVAVTGRLSEIAVVGGRPLGLHLEEQDVDFRTF